MMQFIFVVPILCIYFDLPYTETRRYSDPGTASQKTHPDLCRNPAARFRFPLTLLPLPDFYLLQTAFVPLFLLQPVPDFPLGQQTSASILLQIQPVHSGTSPRSHIFIPFSFAVPTVWSSGFPISHCL